MAASAEGRTSSRLVIAVAALLVALGTPSTATACSSDQPTFEEAVTGARAIAVVTILDGAAPGIPNPEGRQVFHVERVLKGSLPEIVTLQPARATLCGDSVGFFTSGNGAVAIVAFDVPYYDSRIHPVWAFSNQFGLTASAGIPFGARTIADIEAAIVTAVGPLAATKAPHAAEAAPPAPWLPLVAGALALGGLAVAAVMRRQHTRRR